MSKLLILIILCGIDSIVYGKLPPEYEQLKSVGKSVEIMALGRNPDFKDAYNDFKRNLDSNEERGDFGPGANPNNGYENALRIVINFWNHVNANKESIRKSVEDKSDVIYALLGSSLIIESAIKNTPLNENLNLLRKKFYNNFCFSFGANEGIVADFSRVAWNMQCYEKFSGGYDEANLALNNMGLMLAENSKIRKEVVNLMTGFAYRAGIREDKSINYFSFNANSYLQARIRLLEQTVLLAQESSNIIVEFETLKLLREIYLKIIDNGNLKRIEDRMIKILRVEKKISIIQYLQFNLREFFIYLEVFLVILFPLALFTISISDKKNSIQNSLNLTIKSLFGVLENVHWGKNLLRTIWILALGNLITILFTENLVNIGTIMILQ